MPDVPLWPSLVAVIVAVPPSATSVTSPVWDTVATVGALELHATVRPDSVSVLPAASLSVTANCTVPLAGTIVVAGLTTTDATGTSVTVAAALPAFPSLVAVIVAVPAAMPLTSPLLLTVATAALLLAHVTGRPVSAAPAESFGVAVSWTVCTTGRLAVAGATATVATGTIITVTAAVLLLPSLVAVIVAVPATMPVTSPLLLTVAMLGLLLPHVTLRPGKVPPVESIAVAASCTVCPTRTVAVAGETSTDATDTLVTVIAAELLLPSLVAVIVAEPGVMALTRPLALTLATVPLLLDQAIDRPVSRVPEESLVDAVSCRAVPASRVTVAGVTLTEATAGLVTVMVAVSEGVPPFPLPWATTLNLPVSEPAL